MLSGDTDQLQSISPGQPFRLMQQRSAADVAIMKEIVRQVPELRPAVYSLIDRDIDRALATIEQVTPERVPRKEGAWVPGSSVVEFTPTQEEEIRKALSKGGKPAGRPARDALRGTGEGLYRTDPGGTVADADYNPSE